jgi:ligand-binding sensor domain-containing protein/signal transduction histidine kinase
MVYDLNLTQKIFRGLLLGLAGFLFAAVLVRGADSDLPGHPETLRIWRAADGLPSDSVTAILQTRDGFLWLGTGAGLVRFDGVKFTELKLTASPTNNPVRITALCEDSSGHLWIGTQQDGLFKLAEGVVRHFTGPQGLPDNNVTSLTADNQGMVWIGSPSGLHVWTGQGFESFTTRDGLPDDFVSNVNVARSGTVWITTRSGMCRFIKGRIVPFAFSTDSQGRSPEYLGAYEDQQGNLWAFGDTYLINLTEGNRFNYFRSSESASVRIWSLCEGRDGRLWIGTSGRGLFCFEDNRFQPVMLGEERWPYDVRALCEDTEGNLWLGTSGGGLIQLQPQSIHVLRAGQGLPDNPPTSVAVDAGGQIYVGQQRGGLYVGESGRFDRAGSSDPVGLQSFITSVAVAPDGAVWAGTLGDGLVGLRNGRELHYTTADGLADDSVVAVCVDKEGSVWAGTAAGVVDRLSGGQLDRFSTEQGLPAAPISAMIPASDGGLWLGTQNGEVLHENLGKFTFIPAADVSGRHAVLALCEGDQGRLWIGTGGAGLTCLVNGAAMNWTLTNGLPGDNVAGIVEDGAKNLWLATDAGIYCVASGDVRKSLSNAYAHAPLVCQLMSEAGTTPDSAAVFGGPRAALSKEGELWFATSSGVLNVDTRQSKIEPFKFPIYIESLAVNGQPPVSLLQGPLWSFAAGNDAPGAILDNLRTLEIHFTALNYTAPDQIRFRYKLDGFGPDWVDDSGTRTASYLKLPYGRYRFRVAARNANGKWQEAAQSFSFVVPTPLYFQAWAIGCYVVVAVAIVTGIVRVVSHRRLRFALARLEQQQSLERERMRIARDMHDEMGSKLTKISFLSEHAQVDARTDGSLALKIASIAETSRELLKTMDEIVWVVNPRNDTLENLIAYLGHYAVEYFQNTSIECELRLPQEIPHHALSSETRHNLFLTFEEALNNVLKHSAATQVKVEITIAAMEFELKVTDNGRGFEMTAATASAPARGGRGGNGLKNMQQRLTAIGGECLVSSRPGEGASVTLRIPLTKKTSNKS